MKTVEARGNRLTLGRGECDIRVKSPSCSRTHAILSFIPDLGLVLQDLGSTNGTLLNGMKTTRSLIREGDTIQIGEISISILAFYSDEQVRNSGTKHLSKSDEARLAEEGILLGWPHAIKCGPREKQEEWELLRG